MSERLVGEKMASQDNRSTQYPLFVVQETVKRYGPYGDWGYDTSERNHDFDGPVCEKCEEGYADGNGADYPDEYGECDCDSECFNWYQEVKEISLKPGVFFTSEACQEHIEANSYHYSNPVVYGIGAWRNPEMQMVMQYLIQEAGIDEIPSHYKGA